MSFLTDLFEGNTSNLGHDLTAHVGKDLLTAGEIGGGLALGGLGLGALGGAGLLGAETGAATAGADAFAGATAAGEAGGALGAGAGGLAAGSLDTLAATGGLTGDLSTGATGLDAFASASPTASGLPIGATTGGAPAATGAGSFGAPAGVSSFADPTAFNALDAQAGPAGWSTGGAAAPGAGSDAFSGATASGTSGTGTAAGATPASGGGVLDKLGNAFSPSNIAGSVAKNPLGFLAGAGGLGYAMLSGKQTSAATQQLEQQAAQLNAQGQQLASYLTSGNLPPGLKTQLDQATSSAKAAVISNFAKQGMSTDPSQNSALAQELALIDQQAVISTATIGQNLLTAGVSETGMASGLYQTLSNIDQTQTAAIGKAIAAFASAMSPGGTKIQIGGTTG